MARTPATPVPTTVPPGPSVDIGEQRGITLWAWWPDAYATPASDAALARIASVGATWVVLIPTWFQESTSVSSFAPKATFTPTDESILHAVAAAKAVGLKVMLKPHVDVADGACRCAIRPTDVDAWFARYNEMILHYTDIAVSAGVDQLAVGTELAGVSSEAGRWRSLIAAVRGRYRGSMVYAALPSELPRVSFWDALDAIGVDAYWPLADRPTEDAHGLRQAWEPIVAELARMALSWNRPVVFTEAGYASQRGTTTEPGSWTLSTVPAPAEQAAAYNALLAAVPGRPWFRGVHWWAWRVTNETDPLDYTPQDKQAEHALRLAWGS